MTRPSASRSWLRAAGLIAAAIALVLALGASSAAAATAPPELLEPEEATAYSTVIGVAYNLPEDAAAKSVQLTFVPAVGTPVTLTMAGAASTEGTHEFVLQTHNLTPNPEVETASKTSLADGEYRVILSYQNVAEEPVATAEAEEVLVKTVTTAPTLTAPLSSSSHTTPLTVAYTLPEESSPAGATIEITPTGGGTPVVLTLEAAVSGVGSHSVNLNLHALASSADVESASAESIPDGEYTVKVSYQDELENPAASASATGVKIKTSTGAPTLVLPAAAGRYTTPVPIKYTLPEQALAGSAKLEFEASGGSTVALTLTAAASTAGTHSFTITPSNPASNAADIAAVSGGPIADGKYTVKVSFRDALANAAASATDSGVTIKTATAVPTVSEPLAGHAFHEPFSLSYSLPEAAQAGSVQVVLEGVKHGTKTITLTNAAAGSHTVQIDPANPASEAGVASAPAEIPADQYQLVVRYQDELGNPAASSTPLTVRITNGPACKAGTYSATGEAPCEEAPAGSFAGEEGLTSATECAVGYYAPEKGLAVCLPASPGSYVEVAGATSQHACPPGTFAGASAMTKCAPTPANTYATGGAVAPTPCPPGTGSAAGASACTAIVKTGGGRFPSETTAPQGPVLMSPAPGTVTVKISSAKHLSSLLTARRQRYVLRCSIAATVSVQVSAVLRAGKETLTVKAATQAVRCAAGKAYEETARFKLAPAAKTLLHQPGVSVRLMVKIYATGAAPHRKLAGSAVRGGR